jgi:uncharacterized membrane protein YsdA (DUF1294 family)
MTFWNTIKESVKDKFNQISHTRISSYVILVTITINAFVFMGIDVYNAYKSIEIYKIPLEHIAILGMYLGHHLALVGMKRSSETKQSKIEADINNKIINELPKIDSSEQEEPIV